MGVPGPPVFVHENGAMVFPRTAISKPGSHQAGIPLSGLIPGQGCICEGHISHPRAVGFCLFGETQ
eukprot:scaffold2116_cov141-Amphora_coffeaeformis.AAC.1